jgi:hypothetical protein
MKVALYGVIMIREAVVDPAEFKAARQSAMQSDPLSAYR